MVVGAFFYFRFLEEDSNLKSGLNTWKANRQDACLALREDLEWTGMIPGHGKRVLFQAPSGPTSEYS